MSPEERERILADDEARDRLNERAEAVLRAGILPMREQEGKLSCVFLYDDLLSSLQKKHGHTIIPAPCQAYPFGFSENEEGRPVALLSRYCPSIRDDYGEPVRSILPEKLQQAGGARPLAEKMGLRSGRVLKKKQFAQVVESWRQTLGRATSTSDALVRIYEETDAFDEELPQKVPTDADVQQALKRATERPFRPVRPAAGGFNARVFLAYFLGGLCYPARVLMPHRNEKVGWWERVRAFGNRLAWFFGVGRVDLYLVDRPVPLRQARKVTPVLSGELSRLVSEYLSEVLLRRQGMSRQTYLTRVVVDLGLMAVLISQYARAAASSAGRREPTEAQVKEGIGIAELLFSHQSEGAQGAVLQSLRLKLMSDPEDFRRLIGSETSSD